MWGAIAISTNQSAEVGRCLSHRMPRAVAEILMCGPYIGITDRVVGMTSSYGVKWKMPDDS